MKDHKYKRQDWEKPHVIVFGQFPPYPETPYGTKQSHNHYHYSLFGSGSPIATKFIGKDELQQGQSKRNLISEIQRCDSFKQFDHDFGSVRKVEYVKVEKEEVIKRVVQKVQVVQVKKEVVATKIESTQAESGIQQKEVPNVKIEQVNQIKEPEIKQDAKIQTFTQHKKSFEDQPKKESTIEYPDLSIYNPLKCALELRYAGMLSFSLISFALFRHRNIIAPLISIPKIRNAVYTTGALGLLFSVPFFPQIKNLLSNQYRFIKRRILRRNQFHCQYKCSWRNNNRRKKYQAPKQFTFLSKGEHYTNY